MKNLSFFSRAVVLAACLTAVFSMTALADDVVKSRANGLAEEQRRFPFEVVLSEETCERKCYAGYGEKYASGYGITPATEFEIRSVDPTADAAELKIDIDVIYQSESGNSTKSEKVRTYGYGDLTANDGSTYSFFTDRNKENLEERGTLYSDSQHSVRMTLTYNGADQKKEKQYFQVYTLEDLGYYIDNADAAAAAETEPAPAVIY